MQAPGFRWSTRREEAAILVAQDELTNQQIAARVGVSRKTLDEWKRHPDFARRVASHIDSFRNALLARGIAARDARLAALDDLLRRLRVVIEARARDMAGVPGGESGLLVRRTRRILLSAEPDSTPERTLRRERIDEYEIDTVLLRAIQDLARQAAQQLGQWDVAPTPEHSRWEIPEKWAMGGPPLEPDWPLPKWVPGQDREVSN